MLIRKWESEGLVLFFEKWEVRDVEGLRGREVGSEKGLEILVKEGYKKTREIRREKKRRACATKLLKLS